MINHNKELMLITQLHDAGIINAEELKKADLYLSLSSKGFDNHHDAVEWLIHNRAVSRERQDRVRELVAAFERHNSTQSTPPKPQDKPVVKPVVKPVPVQEPSKPIVEPQNAARRIETERAAETRFDSAVVAEIFEFNKKQLRELIRQGDVKPTAQTEIEDKLRGRCYVFYETPDLEEWIESGCPDNRINDRTALQLYSLTKQNIIDEEEYWGGYEELLSAGNDAPGHLTFKDETQLFQWLAEHDCLYHDITDPKQAKNYRENLKQLDKLTDRKLVAYNVTGQIRHALESEHSRFIDEQTLLEWIKQRDLLKPPPESGKKTKKKRRPSFFFILVLIYILYRIFSNFFEDDKPIRITPVKPVKTQSAPAVAQNTIKTSTLDVSGHEALITNMLRQHIPTEDKLKPLGNLVQIKNITQIKPDTYRVNGLFENGSASISFRAVKDVDSDRVLLSAIIYSDIQLQTKEPENQAVVAEAEPESEPLEKHEAVVMDNLRQVDRLMAERQPGSLTLLNIIQKAELTGRCTTGKNNTVLCPFTIYYKDVWMKKNTLRSFKMNVRFVEQNGEPKLQSQVEFIKDLTDKMYKDYQSK